MADTVQTRTLRIQSEERGSDQVAAKLQKIAGSASAADAAIAKYAADAKSAVQPINEALAKSQDDFSKATLSTAKSIQNLQNRVDPVARALSAYEKAQMRVKLAIDSGGISAEKGAAILAGYEARYVSASLAAKKMSDGLHGVNDNAKLTQNQMLNLSRQGNDVITMFALGANPMQIFASQAGQVYDALSAEGGLAAGLSGLKNSAKAGLMQMVAFGASLGPLGIGIAAATAGVVAFAYAFRSKVPDMADTLKDQDDILKQIEGRYDGIRQKIENLPTSSGMGLNIAAGANTRDLGALIKQESHSVSTDFTSYIGQALHGAFDFADAPTRSMFAPIQKQVDAFRKSLADGNPDVAGFRKQLASMYQAAGDNEPLKKAIEAAYEYTKTLADLEDRLHRNQTALKEMGKAEDDLAAKQKHASDTYLSDLDRETQSQQLAIKQIQARTVFEKAMLAGEQVRLGNAGKSMDPALDRAQQAAAEAKVFAQAQRDANDALRDANTALGQVGLDGYAAALKQINDHLKEQIALNPENAKTWEAVAAAQRQALDIETRKSLFESQSDTLTQLKAEASAIGATDRQYSDLTTTVQAKIDLEKQGISVTSAAGAAYVDNARKLAEFTAQVKEQKDAWDSVKQAGSSAIDDLVNGLTGGGSINDALKSVEQDLLKTFTTLGASNPLKNLLTGSSLPTLSDLFAGKLKAPSLSIPGLGSLGTQMNPMYVVPVGGAGGGIVSSVANLLTGGGKGAANDNTSLFGKAIQKIESGGNYSALGPLTKSGDRAYGAYQVMGANIPSWTEQAVGYRMTPNQFLASPNAQDSVFNKIFGGYVSKYGNANDAASAWFTGRPMASGSGASDVLGTTGAGYVSKFDDALASLTQASGTTATSLTKLGSDAVSGLSTAVTDASKGLGNLGSGLASAASSAGSGGSGGWFGNLFSSLGKLFGFEGGGYTGPGGRSQPAGVVHAGEYVMTAAATSKIGVSALDFLNYGYADGGMVRPPVRASADPFLRSPAPANENAPGLNVATHVVVSVDDDGKVKAYVEKSSAKMGVHARQAAVGDVKSGLPGWQQQLQTHGAIS